MYKEIIVETNTEGADFIADAFFSIGVSGVKIIDPNDVDDLIKNGINWDYIDDNLLVAKKDNVVKVSGFVSNEECDSKVAELKSFIDEINYIDLGSKKITVTDFVNEDWLNEWKKFYKPIEIGDFVIVPEWQTYDNTGNKLIIKIDPSMAFGTGDHESTKLCLALMSTINFNDKFVIDVGTGSGILGIGAVKKGASKVYMCDIDSLSIKSATENAVLNGVLDKVTIEESDLVSKTDAVCDIMLANLTADILIRLSQMLPQHLVKGGNLICSGIIHKRKSAVIATFLKENCRLVKEVEMGEWDALLFEKM